MKKYAKAVVTSTSNHLKKMADREVRVLIDRDEMVVVGETSNGSSPVYVSGQIIQNNLIGPLTRKITTASKPYNTVHVVRFTSLFAALSAK